MGIGIAWSGGRGRGGWLFTVFSSFPAWRILFVRSLAFSLCSCSPFISFISFSLRDTGTTCEH